MPRTARERSTIAASHSSSSVHHLAISPPLSSSSASVYTLASEGPPRRDQSNRSPLLQLPHPSTAVHDGARRGSLHPVPTTQPPHLPHSTSTSSAHSVRVSRPGLQSRTSSAPLLAAGLPAAQPSGHGYNTNGLGLYHPAREKYENGAHALHADPHEEAAREDKHKVDRSNERRSVMTLNVEGDEDLAAGVAGVLRATSPSGRSEAPEPLPEVNIAVLAGHDIDTPAFIAHAFGPQASPRDRAAEYKVTSQHRVHLVRLLEVAPGSPAAGPSTGLIATPSDHDTRTDSYMDIGIAPNPVTEWLESGAVSSIPVVTHSNLPRIDGALALYDVRHKRSVEQLAEMLRSVSRESVPTMLIPFSSPASPLERQVDAARVEEDFRGKFKIIGAVRFSQTNPDGNRRTMHDAIMAIIEAIPEYRDTLVPRQRALSSAVRAVSPRLPGNVSHSRASSEFTGSLYKERRYAKQDTSNADYGSRRRLRAPADHPTEQRNGSFLLEESCSEESPGSARSSISTDGAAENTSWLAEAGVTFDELVDRLLAQPASKSDIKYAAVFLALYRKFAAPRQLLDAITVRFDALDRKGGSGLTKTVHQSRYVTILEQWIANYPGDFAHVDTQRRIRAFVSKLTSISILSVAAKEINSHLDMVREDDDTNWAFSDRDHDQHTGLSRPQTLSSTTGTLVDDDDDSLFGTTDLDYSAIHKQFAAASAAPGTSQSPMFHNHMLSHVEAAQKQAALLQPIPRYPITKIQWRTFIELPDDVIAMELTRMDWIMFSAIRPRDLVRHVSLTKDQKLEFRNVAHVQRMVDHFNTLAAWAVNYILLRDKPKHRALMLAKFMRVARRLRELNNYNALGALIAGVRSSAIGRLVATRELIPAATGRDWLKLEILMAPSRSHATYRLAWENSNGDRIPYLPLHRRDLVTAEEGNRTFLDGNRGAEGGPNKEHIFPRGDVMPSGTDPSSSSFYTSYTTEPGTRINWRKFEIMGDVIVSLQRAQEAQYGSLGSFRGNEQLRELVLDAKLVRDEEDLYDRSIQCEPVATPADRTTSTSATGKFRELFKGRMF